MPKCPILSEEPSYNQILLFLKNSEPHMDVLHALPLYIPWRNAPYTGTNSSVLYKQYVFVDLERWGLIELQLTYEQAGDTFFASSMLTRCAWHITLTGEQYLADIDYDGN